MAAWILSLMAAAHAPADRRAVGQASTMILIVALVGIVAVCGLVLWALRRRALAADALHAERHLPEPGDAWAESAKRVALEDDDDIPREPGTA